LHDQPLSCALPAAASAAIADTVAAGLCLAMIQPKDETTTSGPRSPIDGRTETGQEPALNITQRARSRPPPARLHAVGPARTLCSGSCVA